MAKNPTDWPSGGTPWNYSGKVAPSGLDSFANPTDNGEGARKSTATPYTASGKVGKSGGANLGNPYARQSDRTAMKPLAHGNGSMAPGILPSGPEPKNATPKKWHKNRGYAMNVPSGDPDSVGPMRAKHRQIG